MSPSWRMGKENVVHSHRGVYSAVRNNDIIIFERKYMELEKVILSKVTQTLKDKHDG